MTKPTLATPLSASLAPSAPFKKAVGVDLLPPGLPHRVRFQLAVEAGFEAIEMSDVADAEEAEEVHEAALGTGLRIHSTTTYETWWHPLSSEDGAEVQQGLCAVRTALANAKRWGADTLLLIPAMVNARTSYHEAYTRSQSVIRRELLPLAEELGIVLGIENAWSGFLLSPLEYVRYIDEFASPWVRAYLDVGNMVFGYPEHWIRLTGSRLAKVHLKDFRLDRARGRFAFEKVGQGDVDWGAVRAALLEVGFCGEVTSTGTPRDRWHRWLAGGVRRARRSLVARSDLAIIFHTLSAVRRPVDIHFLQDVARRFDRFRDGHLP